MTPRDPALVDRLAAAYVLGTLEGRARRRFERMQRTSLELQRAVSAWEHRLSPLAEAISAVKPPARVWRGIARRIAPPRRFQSLELWHGLTFAASAAAIALAVTLLLMPARTAGPGQVAVFQGAQDAPLWLVSTDLDSGTLVVRALNAHAVALDRVFQLWVLPASGPPQSLGVLPVDGQVVRQQLDENLSRTLTTAAGLAVSLEPPGGSPTGLPTGPVIHQAPLVAL
jgi:anti-sigma-K factor RskA